MISRIKEDIRTLDVHRDESIVLLIGFVMIGFMIGFAL